MAEILDFQEPEPKDDQADAALVMSLFARMDHLGMALAFGVAVGITFCLATAILLIKGGSADAVVGYNLGTVSAFLPGYSVSWIGSLVGLAYGVLGGMVFGFGFALLWNFAHVVAVGIVILKADWFDLA